MHRGHIVNVSRIIGVNTMIDGAYERQLKGDATLRTGRQYADAVRALLKSQ